MKKYDYSLVPAFQDSRCGFNHVCKLSLYLNNRVYKFSGKVHYINRTWESRIYRTVELVTVSNAIKEIKEEIKETVRNQTGKTLRDKITKNLFLDLVQKSPELAALTEIYKKI